MNDKANAQVKIKEGFVGQRMFVLSRADQKKINSHFFGRLLYFTAIGYYPLATFHERRRTHGCDEYILLYCIHGEGWLNIADRHYEVRPNRFFIIPKNTAHHYGSSAKQPWTLYWLHFTGEHADAYYERYAQLIQDPANEVVFDEGRITGFNYLMEVFSKPMTPTVIDTLYTRLIEVIASFLLPPVTHQPPANDLITASINYMNENIRQPLLIKDLANNANYSVSRYSELFRLRTGYSPMQYFLEIKIQKACQYLCFTGNSVKQIAHDLGFDDPFYFSRLFKKHTAYSPLKYKQLNRRTAGSDDQE